MTMDKTNKKTILKVIGFSLLIVGVILIFALGIVFDRTSTPDNMGREEIGNPYIEVSTLDEEVSLVGDVVLEWLDGESTATELYKKYSEYGTVYTSKSVLLYYSIFELSDSKSVVSQKIELSENSAFKDAKIYNVGYDKRNIRFDYLYTGKNYYYRITAALSDGTQIQANGQFRTADTPRLVILEGARNVRDIGGWQTVDGKIVRQGLFYRGSELDGVTEKKYVATDFDIEVLRDVLGIKTQMDLRGDSVGGKAFDKNVAYKTYAALDYNSCFADNGEQVLKNIFKDLSVKENYPVYMHCNYGTDVTGTASYFLGAVLGMSEQTLYKDWEMSVLCNGGASYKNMDAFVQNFKALEGETMQDKAYNYLISIGITREELDSIREILLED